MTDVPGLHDAIAQALLANDHRFFAGFDFQDRSTAADVCLTVLRHTLQQHPELIGQLGLTRGALTSALVEMLDYEPIATSAVYRYDEEAR